MIKPNLFIPGFAKCGTSSLHSMLSQHEEIHVGKTKEPHFYTREYSFCKRYKIFKECYGEPQGNCKYILDSSTGYSVFPKAIERIKKDSPEAKFIILCRDPLERVISHYNWMSSLGFVELSFKEEIEKNGLSNYDPKFHYKGNFKTYIEASKYGRYIKNITESFGKENVLVLKFERLFNEWESERSKIAQFLALSNFKTIDKDHKNKTKKVRKEEGLSTTQEHKLKRVAYFFKNELNYLLGRRHKTQKINNPINNYVNKEEVDLSFLLKYLKDDIRGFQEMGYNIDGWETTKKYLGLK